MVISVVVCTHNRRELLSGCLRSLAQQSASKESYEVIVTDNDSSDGTRALVQEYSRKEPNFRYCHETRRGANHARNAGVAIARGSYLAFIDDDAIAAGDWLAEIQDFVKRRPEVRVFGGPYTGHSMVPAPAWFPPEYGSLTLGTEERKVEIGREWITGTNLIVESEAFRDVGGFHERLGAVEKGTFYFGEETRLLIELSSRGHDVYYVPTVQVSHLIRSDKMHLKYLLRSAYLVGLNYNLTFKVKRSPAELLLALAATVAKGCYSMVITGNTPLKRRLYYALSPVMGEMGAVVEYFSTLWQHSNRKIDRDSKA